MPPAAEDAYYHNPRHDLLPFVPTGIKRALDVGCGAGAFGATLKQERGAEVHGIEVVREVAEQARQRLDLVWNADALEQMRTLPSGSYDLVSFNDVLEHTVWPGDLLVEAQRLLLPSGTCVASLPNFRYWETFKPLLWDGEWEYTDAGILDRTHLRFFTRKSIERLFLACGFQIESIAPLHSIRSRILRAARPLVGKRMDDSLCLQWAVVARPTGTISPHPLREKG